MESSVNLTAKNSVANPKNPVTALTARKKETGYLTSRGDTFTYHSTKETITRAKNDRRYKISNTVIGHILNSSLTEHIKDP